MKYYLDYNATAPMRPEVVEVMRSLETLPLNASSVHVYGRQAKNVLEQSRRTVAEAIGVFTQEIIFTSTGTEANNWVLTAFANSAIVISAIEHSSVYKTAHQLSKPTILPVDINGVVDLEALPEVLKNAQQTNKQLLVSVMLANNETGVIQPVRVIADIVHQHHGLLHCDAIQALGKITLDFTMLGCDMLTVSAHKMGGPVGAAALIVRNNLPIKPMLLGGGQELNRRAGTENIAAIAGFAKAVELIDLSQMQQLEQSLRRFEADSETHSHHNVMVIGKNAPRLPNTSCLMLAGISAETQLIRCDLASIAVSAGSACSSGRIEPSHVLAAMSIAPEQAACAIRISGGWATTHEDIDALSRVYQQIILAKKSA